ncbi:ABC transporter substrate-binding protein [Lutibacter sp.]|uniref:ABC transporter substrate-binding protein n=1 Tax=Lutibacter sp. TaxID=1925666 RepID=UPI0025BDB6CE|nr:ABC transporter substrate-binding protein [Lutibacter sp.]MCF6181582.1 ABC transporter substrate-binding protein [Lutibacter sp.]
MKFKFPFFTIIAILFLILNSCNSTINNKKNEKILISKTNIKYAKGFEIQHFKDFTKLIIKAPYPNSKETFEFKLSSKKSKDINTIHIPIKSLVVTSTTHIPFLELLNEEDKLVGFPNTKYISSKKTRKRIEKGFIKDLGNEEQINTELLLNLHPDVVVGFTLNASNKMFTTIEKLGIPVLLNGDWFEETPLGRAEWIKFFGVLFKKEKLADSIFNNIEKNYLNAKTIALKATNKPSVISGGLFKDIWNLPAGNSFEASFLADANTNYLYKNTKGKGSLSLNIENVFTKGKDATIWISPSFYKNLDDLKNANDIYSKFKAFKTKKIYSYVNNKGATGGIIYFELAPARPDLVLKDLIKIAHPKLLKYYKLTFYRQLR